MSDLIERLLAAQLRGNTPPSEMRLLEEAAKRIAELEAEVERLQFNHYPHMCRDGHPKIGHGDSEFEQCPLCRTIARAEAAERILAASPDKAGERIAELEAENTHIVAESKQCHEQNDRLVSEHMILIQRIAELEDDYTECSEVGKILLARAEAAEAKLAAVGELQRYTIMADTYITDNPNGEWLRADELEALLKS